MKLWKRISWASVALLALAGCSPEPVPTLATVTDSEEDVDPWVLTCTDPTNETPAFISNGRVGVRIARDGSSYGPDGDLPLFHRYAYPINGDEAIIPLDSPYRLKWYVNGTRLEPPVGSEYEQTLDVRENVLVTKWSQVVDDLSVHIRAEAAIHPSIENLVGVWSIEVDGEAEVVCEIEQPQKTDQIFMVDRIRLKAPDAMESDRDAGRFKWTATKDDPIRFSISYDLDINSDAILSRRLNADIHGQWNFHKPTVAITIGEARQHWGESWGVDIRIDGPRTDQRAVRSMVHYLRTSTSDGVMGVSPMGLSGDTYKGHVFWDMDVWALPALVLLEPDVATAFARYRTNLPHGYSPPGWWSRSFYDWRKDGYPTGDGSSHEPQSDLTALARDIVALKIAWESSATTDETASGPSRFQEHVSGDSLWAAQVADDLGLLQDQQVVSINDLGQSVAAYYLSRMSTRPDGATEIRNVTGVDEWFEGDNCLYTNAIADWTIKRYLGEDVNMYYPRDEKGLLAYDGDERMAYKQAAAPLILWPLEREDLVEDPIAFLDLFEGKEAPNGPAMSLSVYALIRARYGDADHAYETWRESWKKYTDGNPLMLFSEKPGRPDLTYFLTGAAGCLNAVIYGFIGVRIVDEEPPEEAKLKIMNGKWLVVRPNLPKAWKSVTFKGMQVLGKRYDVHCVGRTATITPTD